MIGVLAQQDDFDLIDGGGVEGVEDEPARRINGGAAHSLCFEEGGDLQEIRLCKLLLQGLFPAFFDLDVHR